MESVLTKKQKRTYEKYFTENGKKCRIKVTARYDDECGNGHNSFAITADISENGRWVMGGCCHDEIAKHFPELRPLIKWHLCDSDGPMYYIDNTVYLAGDKDCHGRSAGEASSYSLGVRFDNVPIVHELDQKFYDFLQARQGTGDFQIISFAHKEPKTFSPNWSLVGFGDSWHGSPFHNKAEAEQFCQALNTCKVSFDRYATDYSQGKDRELDAARRCAIWPDATDEQLTAPGLKKRLLDRLPALLSDFQAVIESLGFTY